MKDSGKLNTEQKQLILQSLAEFKTLSEIQLMLMNEFEVDVSLQNISNYKTRYLDEIKEIRRKYLWNLGEQASYHKRWRIAVRERMLRKILDKGEIEYFNVADRILNSIRAESDSIILPPDDRELGLF